MRGGPANRRNLLPRSSQGLTFPFTLYAPGGNATSPQWFPTGDLTAEMRIYVEDYGNPPGQTYSDIAIFQILILANQGNGAYSWALALKNRRLMFRCYSTGQEHFANGPEIPTKTLLHVAAAEHWNEATQNHESELFVNGVSRGTMEFTQRIPPTRVMSVGNVDSARGYGPFYGAADSMRLWGYRRTNQELADNWRYRNGDVPGITPANMVAMYEFEEVPLANTATIIADGSGNGRYMTSSTNTWEGSTSVTMPQVL